MTKVATAPANLPDLATTGEAASYLRTTTGALAYWRYRHDGPRYVKSGARVLYPRAALDEWLKTNP